MDCNMIPELEFDSETGSILFDTADISFYQPGDYRITIKASVGLQITTSTNIQLTLTLINPCLSAEIVNRTFRFEDVTFSLEDDPLFIYYDESELATFSTRVNCGEITIEFFSDENDELELNPALFSTFQVSYTKGIFIVQQKDTRDIEAEDLIGDYEIHYAAYSTEYPAMGVLISEAFIVTIVDQRIESFEKEEEPMVVVAFEPTWLTQLQD